jgi:signal transduction histidine kinase
MSDKTAMGVDLNTFLAAQIHELKNDLGQLALSLDEIALSHPEAAEFLKSSRFHTGAIVDRLVQVLTLYRHESGKLLLNLEAHDPRAFIEELAAEARSLAGTRVRVECQVQNAPPFWFFDRYLTAVAMMTALHNALEFASRVIEIGARSEDGGLCLYVRDDSNGYPPHIIENQGIQPGKSAGGTGLGLYFAQVIARAHENNGREGRLQLENNNGALFTMWLP